jgi:hypothetical protein
MRTGDECMLASASSAAYATECPTCGTPRAGLYCAECGQPFRSSRLSIRSIATDVVSSLTEFDRGIPYTAKGLFIQPGAVVRSYVNGATRRVTGPAKYLLICAAVGAVVYFQLGWLNTNTSRLGTLTNLARDHLSLVLVARVPVASLLSFLLFKRAGYNLAEHLVFNAYATAQSLLILALTAPVALLGGISMESYAVLLVGSAVAYYVWASVDFFRVHPYADAVRAVVIQVLIVICYMILLGFGTGALSSIRPA